MNKIIFLFAAKILLGGLLVFMVNVVKILIRALSRPPQVRAGYYGEAKAAPFAVLLGISGGIIYLVLYLILLIS